MRRALTAISIATLPFFGTSVAFAAGLAYVRASSQHQLKQQRGRYHPLNVLDGDPNTAWCEGADGLGEGETVYIQFKAQQRIDRIVIHATPQSGRAVTAVRVSDGTASVVLPMTDEGTDQTLSRPFLGSTYSVSFEKVGPQRKDGAAGPDTSCLGDVLLYNGKLLFGSHLNSERLRYDARLDKLLGRWMGGPLGAPEKELVFALDGTWEWKFEPLLGGKSRRNSGEYRFRGNRLLMREGEVGRWSDMQFKHEHVAVDTTELGAPLGDYDKVRLGTALGNAIAGDYNNAQF